jgi:hypothetical protein
MRNKEIKVLLQVEAIKSLLRGIYFEISAVVQIHS